MCHRTDPASPFPDRLRRADRRPGLLAGCTGGRPRPATADQDWAPVVDTRSAARPRRGVAGSAFCSRYSLTLRHRWVRCGSSRATGVAVAPTCATRPRPARCVQDTVRDLTAGARSARDCLSLNVFSPAGAAARSRSGLDPRRRVRQRKAPTSTTPAGPAGDHPRRHRRRRLSPVNHRPGAPATGSDPALAHFGRPGNSPGTRAARQPGLRRGGRPEVSAAEEVAAAARPAATARGIEPPCAHQQRHPDRSGSPARC